MPRRSTKAYIPGKTFPSVSITGTRCWLQCRYCMARYLGQMEHVDTPEGLYWYARQISKMGGRGLLVSGGYTVDGKLPFKPFLSGIKRIKKELGLIISIHPGLVDRVEAEQLRDAGVDIVDYELILDEMVIRHVLGLKRTPDDFIRSFEYLLNHGPSYVAPHLLVGANYGVISWEYKAVDLLASYNPYMIVFLSLIPTKYTPMEKVSPPSPSSFIRLLRYAREKHPSWIISVGCMRPRQYKVRVDPIIIDNELADRIVLPRREYIIEYDLEVVNACCSVPDELLY